MHAYILVNNDPIDFANKQNTTIIPFTLQKIEDSRELKKLVKFSFPEKTAIIIENIDTATNETANAFLKNLEEPTKNIIYILTASNIDNVLPTIISRCQIIKSSTINNSPIDNIQTQNFLNSKFNQQFEIIGKIKDRGEAIKFIEDLIFEEHKNGKFTNMENCLNTIKNLKANGNVSLQLTNFVVTMNR